MDGIYTLEEAADLTGVSAEALRKRWMRGRLEGSKSNEDGRVRVRLTTEQVSDLRREATPSKRVDKQVDESSTVKALSAHVQTLSEQLARSEARADTALTASTEERQRHDAERAELLAQIVIAQAATAAALDQAAAAGRERDGYRRQLATIRQAQADAARARAERQQATPKTAVVKVVAPAPAPRGFLARVFGLKLG